MIRLMIDTKSLYFNIKNDNERGHTATVATPIKQGSSEKPELYLVEEIPENICEDSREGLISQILSKSRAEAIIPNIFVFDNISVNGCNLDNKVSFCAYVREEVGTNNVHFGRKKLHYPISLTYEDVNVEIDNRSVIKMVSDYLKGYAFLIESLDYEPESKVLNFNALVVGPNQVPYSKVFVNRRGAGNKFSNEMIIFADNYDTEIISLREAFGYQEVGPENYYEVMQNNRNMAVDIVRSRISLQGGTNIRDLKNEYPYSLYDLEYYQNGIKRYIIVKQTSTRLKQFTLNSDEIMFLNDFSELVELYLVTDINRDPETHIYGAKEVSGMSKLIKSIQFEDRMDL